MSGDPEELTEYSLADLLTPPPALDEPAGFDDFWRATFEEFGTGAVAWDVTEALEPNETHRIERILFDSSTGERVIAWLFLPHGPVSRGRVIGHGYGGRDAPEPDLVPADTAAIFPVAPGLDINPAGRLGGGIHHVLAGISSRETYSHRFSAADIWRAATVLLEAAPGAAASLDYLGGSFGGGIGALALPWDARFRRGALDVPSFGHYPIRLTRRSTGSNEFVRQHLRRRPSDRATLDWFDSAIAARRIRIPVLVGAAVKDPSVDPRGQFAVFHALGGPRRLVIRGSGHLEGPVEELSSRMFGRAAEDFFALPDDRVR